VRGLENEMEVARSREEAFLQGLKEAKGEARGQSAVTGQAEVQLRALQREASADRSLYESFLVRLKEVEEQQQIIAPDVRIVSPADVPGAPSTPPPAVFALIGFTGSLVLGSILAVLLEQQDTALRNRWQVEGLLGVHGLGLVPAVDEFRSGLRNHFVSKSGSAYAEGVRSLFTQLHWANEGNPPKVLLVTSALPGEGKTSLAGSLALCAAQLKQSVLLIDLDLRRPAVGGFFGLELATGITEFLSGDAYFEDVVQKNEDTGVDVLAVAKVHDNPTALLVSDRLQLLLREARTRYDRIIIDSPPVLGVADAKIVAPAVDAVLFVIRWERTKRDAAQAALKELGDVSANVVGAVLNNVDMKRHAHYAYGDAGQYYMNYSRYYRE
jgi:polysaccharide biosynthesis transport protein